MAGKVHLELCDRPPLGRLGRNLGTLPPHDRRIGDGGSRGCVPAATTRERALAPDYRSRANLVRSQDPKWFSVTYMLNNLNRGLGSPDSYPFLLSDAVIQKLRFVHDTIEMAAAN